MATSDLVPVRSAPRLAAPSSHVVLQSRVVEQFQLHQPGFPCSERRRQFSSGVTRRLRTVPQNENVVRDFSPLPDPKSTFDCFLRVTDFSVLDTNSACYGLSLSPSGRWYSTLCGLYEFVSSCRSCIRRHVVSQTVFSGASVSDSCLMTLATC